MNLVKPKLRQENVQIAALLSSVSQKSLQRAIDTCPFPETKNKLVTFQNSRKSKEVSNA